MPFLLLIQAYGSRVAHQMPFTAQAAAGMREVQNASAERGRRPAALQRPRFPAIQMQERGQRGGRNPLRGRLACYPRKEFPSQSAAGFPRGGSQEILATRTACF